MLRRAPPPPAQALIAILGGLGAAGAWTVSTLCSSRSSRLIDPLAVVAGMMIAGLFVCAPIAALEGVPRGLHGEAWLWLVLAGTADVAGLIVNYMAFRTGQVALVEPIVCTDGAVAALIAILAGESIGAAAGAALALAAGGVCLTSIPRRAAVAAASAASPAAATSGLASPAAAASIIPSPAATVASAASPATATSGLASPAAAASIMASPAATALRTSAAPNPSHFRVVALAGAAALIFGLSLYATGRASTMLPAAWVVLAARAVGVSVLALPLALRGSLKITRQALPFVVASGFAEVAGFFSYIVGTRHGLAIAAVLGSQVAPFAVAFAFVFFRERLTRIQFAGVCTIIIGISLLSALNA